MKLSELFIVVIVYLILFTIGAFIIYFLWPGHSFFACVIGVIVGAETAAVLYHRRIQERAPFSVKAVSGAVLSVMTLVTGIISQVILKWMVYPEVDLSISAVGSFFFPFAIFGTFQKAYSKTKTHHK